MSLKYKQIKHDSKDVEVIDHTVIRTIEDYANAAVDTAIYPTEYSIIYPALGLAGEAGETLDKIKKIIRDNNADFSDEQKRNEIAKELGDVMWYVACLSKDLGVSLTDICQANIEKLQSRKVRNVLHGSGDNR